MYFHLVPLLRGLPLQDRSPLLISFLWRNGPIRAETAALLRSLDQTHTHTYTHTQTHTHTHTYTHTHKHTHTHTR